MKSSRTRKRTQARRRPFAATSIYLFLHRARTKSGYRNLDELQSRIGRLDPG